MVESRWVIASSWGGHRALISSQKAKFEKVYNPGILLSSDQLVLGCEMEIRGGLEMSSLKIWEACGCHPCVDVHQMSCIIGTAFAWDLCSSTIFF